MRKKINIVTLGCAKNLVDSEQVMGRLERKGFQVVHNGNINDAKVVVINTCGFIRDAKQESIDTILRFIKGKQEGSLKEVFVMGCLSERYRDELIMEIPEVDSYFGARDIGEVLRSLTGSDMSELTGERHLTTPKHYAYLKISEGCSRQCSFCAIPAIRGHHISKPIEEIVAEAGSLVQRGVKELILIAQDTTWYGLDIYKRRALPELVEKLAAIPGLQWLRIHYTYPENFPMSLLDVMSAHPNVCRYIDIPVQHISNRILKSMNRGIDAEGIRRLLANIRERVSGIAIRTSLIAGYPGETQQEFEELMNFVEEQRFERLGVFAYSHEEGTPAFALHDDIPEEVKLERMENLMLLQQDISLLRNQSLKGQVIKIMTDRIEDGLLFGRTEFDSPEIDNEVVVRIFGNLTPGVIAKVKVLDATEFDLHAISTKA